MRFERVLAHAEHIAALAADDVPNESPTMPGATNILLNRDAGLR